MSDSVVRVAAPGFELLRPLQFRDTSRVRADAGAAATQAALHTGCIRIRPIRSGEVDRHAAFIRSLSAETRRRRFLGAVRDLPIPVVQRLTDVDGVERMTLVAQECGRDDASWAGVALYVADGDRCEFAVVVHDDWQGQGVGRQLLSALLAHAAAAGWTEIEGEVLRDNVPMLKLAASLGFDQRRNPDVRLVTVVRKLDEAGSKRVIPLRASRSGAPSAPASKSTGAPLKVANA